jgi:hypothetical protein
MSDYDPTTAARVTGWMKSCNHWTRRKIAGRLLFGLSMTFSDLPSPAEAGFAKAGNRFPLFGVMLYPLKRRIRRLDWAATFSDSVGFP